VPASPFRITLTPDSGELSDVDETLPVMVVCANADVAQSIKHKVRKITFMVVMD
jgi:hypothetical protein